MFFFGKCFFWKMFFSENVFFGKSLQKCFEIPQPQVASFEELESGNPLGGGGEFAVTLSRRKNNILFLPPAKTFNFSQSFSLCWGKSIVFFFATPEILRSSTQASHFQASNFQASNFQARNLTPGIVTPETLTPGNLTP